MTRKVLVVCFGNTCRSPAFAAVLTQELEKLGRGEEFTVESAGCSENAAHGNPAAPEWLKLQELDEIDIDLTDHQSRSIDTLALNDFDMVISLDTHASMVLRQKDLPDRKFGFDAIPNPWMEGRSVEDGLRAYRECWEAIHQYAEPRARMLATTWHKAD